MIQERQVVSSGNSQMDEILKGGFPANSINVIMGQPGTGKTVFAEQLIFYQATDEARPIVYLTTLSEPVAKVLSYLQLFGFYDDDKIGKSIHYHDLGQELADKGIGSLVSHLEELIHGLSPKIIVIDSFRALHDLATSAHEMRRMLHKLTGLLTAFECTVFLVGEYTDEHAKSLPEFAIADGIVQFLRSPQSSRDERFVRVLKLRGSAYLEGLHGCRITSSGLEFYPRLVTPEVPEEYTLKDQRVPSGIDGLDRLLGGGLTRGSSNLLIGSTGSGKTTFGLQFALAGLNRDERRSLVLNFQENPTQLARSIKRLSGGDQQPPGLELMYVSPVEMQVDGIIVTLFKRIETEGIGRVVIDSVGDLAMVTSDTGRLHDLLYALVQHFAAKGITSLMTFESVSRITGGSGAPIGRFSYMSDNIISLELSHGAVPRRQLVCIKAREAEHDLAAHEFRIDAAGLHLLQSEGKGGD